MNSLKVFILSQILLFCKACHQQNQVLLNFALKQSHIIIGLDGWLKIILLKRSITLKQTRLS